MTLTATLDTRQRAHLYRRVGPGQPTALVQCRLEPGRVIAAQQLPEFGRRERLRPGLLQEAARGQEPEQPGERSRFRTDLGGQLVHS